MPQNHINGLKPLALQENASYCVEVMRRRTRWISCAVICVALLALGATVVSWSVLRFRSVERQSFASSCLQRTSLFEDFAQLWVVRGQVASLEASAQLMLYGNARSVEVYVQGQRVISLADDGFADVPWDLEDPESATLQSTLIRVGSSEDVCVVMPSLLPGSSGQPLGWIRAQCSGQSVSAAVVGRAFRGSSIVGSLWIAVCIVLVLATRRLTRVSRGAGNVARIECGDLRIDHERREVFLNDAVIELSPKLYELLVLFARNPGCIFSDQDLLDALWADASYATSADVKQHIYLLRQRLKAVHPDPKAVIENVKGYGYRLEPPNVEEELNPHSCKFEDESPQD